MKIKTIKTTIKTTKIGILEIKTIEIIIKIDKKDFKSLFYIILFL